jgi:gliding motility-associatede transport system auxiliary component
MMHPAEAINIGWFFGVIAAFALLFAAGLRLPVRLGFASRAVSAALVVAAVVAITILGNMALFRHDAHLDLTREKPSHLPSKRARWCAG